LSALVTWPLGGHKLHSSGSSRLDRDRSFGNVIVSRFWKIHSSYEASGPLDGMSAYFL